MGEDEAVRKKEWRIEFHKRKWKPEGWFSCYIAMKERSSKKRPSCLNWCPVSNLLFVYVYLYLGNRTRKERDVLDHTWANPWQACALFVSTSYTSPFSFHLVNHLNVNVITPEFINKRDISFQFLSMYLVPGLAADLTKILKQLSSVDFLWDAASKVGSFPYQNS